MTLGVDDLIALGSAVLALLSTLYAIGVRRGRDVRRDEDQDATDERLAQGLERLASAFNRIDVREEETLRQVKSLHQRLDDHERELRRIDKEQTGTAMIMKWLRTTGQFILPPSPGGHVRTHGEPPTGP